MAAMQLGTKHVCFSCNAKFYDLGRPELVCPKCGANQDEAPEKVDMSAIAAKVMASSVQESEPGADTGAPLADDMDIFGGENQSGNAGDSDSDSSDGDSGFGEADFCDDEDDF